MIVHKKMSLFDAPAESVIVHACNSQGVWGSGIAKEFKERFPNTYKQYNKYCVENNKKVMGTVLVGFENDVVVGNLITSENYASLVDSPEVILKNTESALNELLEYLEEQNIKTVYSNKFNSGLFRVPWEQTESLIKKCIEPYNMTWIVCSPD